MKTYKQFKDELDQEARNINNFSRYFYDFVLDNIVPLYKDKKILFVATPVDNKDKNAYMFSTRFLPSCFNDNFIVKRVNNLDEYHNDEYIVVKCEVIFDFENDSVPSIKFEKKDDFYELIITMYYDRLIWNSVIINAMVKAINDIPWSPDPFTYLNGKNGKLIYDIELPKEKWDMIIDG